MEKWSIVSAVRKAKEKSERPLDLTIRRCLITCESVSAISLKLGEEESDIIILRKTAAGQTVKAPHYRLLPREICDR